MKQYWRCFVCNDIHFGVHPPEVCPTCKAGNAYVRISEPEARRMCLPETEPPSREAFRTAIREFAQKNDFQVNPDGERVETLLEGIFANEANHGLKYCPCRLATKDFMEDMKIVCPCNFLVHETYRDQDKGECWCGLFVRRPKNG